jgi:hypothetical protein
MHFRELSNPSVDIKQFRENISNNSGFNSQRKYLTYISLLIMAINLMGATITEVNTFLFKMEFSQPLGLLYFLNAAGFLCLIRYYSFSSEFFNQLSSLWKIELLESYHAFSLDPETGESDGFLTLTHSGKNSKLEEYLHYIGTGSQVISYKKHLFFRRSLKFSYSEDSGQTYKPIIVWPHKDFKIQNFLIFMALEYRYRLDALFNRPDTLNIWGPIFLYALATITTYYPTLFNSIAATIFMRSHS